MSKRNIYLEKTDLETARKIVIDRFGQNLKFHKIKSENAFSQILSKPVYARLSSPPFHVSAMDGVAVDSINTDKASKTAPIKLEIGKNAFLINTGEAIPPNTDSVIMIENLNFITKKDIEIDEASYPFQNVRKTGEDIVATEMIFPFGHLISPQDIGALLSAGIEEVEVIKRPVIKVIPTGNELVSPGISKKDLKPGSVIESNSSMLCAFIEKEGGIPIKSDASPDNPDILADRVDKYSKEEDTDIILVIGGSSAGSRDYTRSAIEKNGDVLIHGITIMPGKPAISGIVNNKPIFGVPGYPVSAAIIFEMLIKPLILKLLGKDQEIKDTLDVYPVRSIPSKLGTEEFVRVKIGKIGDKYIAAPLPRGAGTITSVTEADAIIRIPSNFEGITDHEPSKAELLREKRLIENTLLMVGSHDNTIDILTQLMAKKGMRLSSTHVGSMGGITAIKKNAAHLAGIHLLDTQTGEYNISYLKKYLPNKKLKIVSLVSRYQGLIVKKGNPLNIKSLKDLEQRDLKFINRQKGSGTRILTDFECQKNNIDTSKILGFNTEEYTHMNIAVSVKSDAADAGMGIMAAAKAIDLDFIPISKEEYQIIIPQEFFNKESTISLMEIINSSEFKKEALKAGGYETDNTGKIKNYPILEV